MSLSSLLLSHCLRASWARQGEPGTDDRSEGSDCGCMQCPSEDLDHPDRRDIKQKLSVPSVPLPEDQFLCLSPILGLRGLFSAWLTFFLGFP